MAIELQQFTKTLTYSNTAPVAVIQSELRQIAEFVQIAKDKKKRFDIIFLVSFLGLILSFFLLAVFVGFVTLIGSVIGIIYAAIMLRKYPHCDVANYRYELLQKVLTLICRDAAQDSPININLVLSPPTTAAKKIETTPHPQRQGWKIDHFRDPWLQVKGYFLDDTHFSLQVTELHVTQYGWKRGRSGKSKYKKKSKPKAQELALTLTFPRKTYGALSVLKQDAIAAIQLPKSVRLTRLKVGGHRLHLMVKTPAWADVNQGNESLYQTITLMYLSLYQILNLARVLTKS